MKIFDQNLASEIKKLELDDVSADGFGKVSGEVSMARGSVMRRVPILGRGDSLVLATARGATVLFNKSRFPTAKGEDALLLKESLIVEGEIYDLGDGVFQLPSLSRSGAAPDATPTGANSVRLARSYYERDEYQNPQDSFDHMVMVGDLYSMGASTRYLRHSSSKKL